MDVIYHKNCLDGVYSAYLIYLLAHHIKEDQINKLIDQLNMFKMNSNQNIQNNQKQNHMVNQQALIQQSNTQYNCDITNYLLKQKILLNTQIKTVNQQLFHQQVPFSAYGIIAGKYQQDYYPSKYKNKILFILDNNCQNASNIQKLAQKYSLVIIIDHHTSFQQTKIQLKSLKLKNVYYIWKEGFCATYLVYKFLNDYFDFSINCLEEKYKLQLEKIIQYVGKNDLKLNQDKISKMFVLGFYYFNIQLSQINPWLFKRIGCLQLDYLLQRGKNIYSHHFEEIQEAVSRCSLAEVRGKFNGICLALSPQNVSIISDIGTVLSYLSAKNKLFNLAILFIPNGDTYRVSCRSYRRFSNPLALQISLKFGGGGHKQAAGFRTSKQQFKSFITVKGYPKFNVKLKINEIEDIIFNKAEI